MPSQFPSFEVVHKPSKFPPVARQALERFPIDASVILPTLNKCAELDRAGNLPSGHLWIVIYSGPGRVALVLACTQGYMGAYPIFIVNTDAIDDADFNPCIHLSALTLKRHVPIERVYSVFAPIRITKRFSEMWTQLTGVQPEAKPYYDSKISHLRWHEGLQQPFISPEGRVEVGLASQADIQPIARLCHEFAKDSPPFTLTEEAALMEAKKLESSKQVWVLKVNGRVVSLAAFTRNTRQVASITKVYTDSDSRKKGYAEHLIRRLCNSLLQEKGREAVVLFVGVDNAAAHVYRRVKFQGLDNLVNGSAVDNVGRWLEMGFDRKRVTLGHW